MSECEACPQLGDALIVSIYPDVCLNDAMVPVPYTIVAYYDTYAINASSDVHFKGVPATHMKTRGIEVEGDEAGVNGGVSSGVNTGFCRPQAAQSSTVMVNGQPCNRDTDEHLMNCDGPEGPSNTLGRSVYAGASAPKSTVAADGSVNGATNASPDAGGLSGFGKEVANKLAQDWEGLKATVRDATGFGKEGAFGEFWQSYADKTNESYLATDYRLGGTDLQNQASEAMVNDFTASADHFVGQLEAAGERNGTAGQAGRLFTTAAELVVGVVVGKGMGGLTGSALKQIIPGATKTVTAGASKVAVSGATKLPSKALATTASKAPIPSAGAGKTGSVAGAKVASKGSEAVSPQSTGAGSGQDGVKISGGPASGKGETPAGRSSSDTFSGARTDEGSAKLGRDMDLPDWATDYDSLKDKTVVDVGGGGGAFTRELREAGVNAYGVDLTRETFPAGTLNDHFIQGNALKLPLATGSADGAYSNWSVFYYYDRATGAATTTGALDEIARVVKPGGTIRLIGVDSRVLDHITTHPSLDLINSSSPQYGTFPALELMRR